MAHLTPIDIDIRSQSFFRTFYLFYKYSYKAWYIKDANHHYVDASLAFLSRFLPSDLTSVAGLCDADMTSASERDIKIMYDYESLVMDQGKEIIVLACKYFSGNNGANAFIIKMEPYPYGKRNGIMVYVFSLVEFSKKIEWLSSIITGVPSSCSKGESAEPTFFNPRPYVTDKEWEVAWLLICGFSIRWIAKYLNVRSQTVYNKSRNVYMKLRVFNKPGLTQMANKHGWINIIPERFTASPMLIRIS
jgi:DNA-binding CsgD family transcriptional regulator